MLSNFSRVAQLVNDGTTFGILAEWLQDLCS